MTWAIKQGWSFEAVEVAKETDKMVFYVDRGWRTVRESRMAKNGFLTWRGDEKTAEVLVVKLTSAKAEFERRRLAAADWYKTRESEILASVDTLPKGQDAKQGLAGTEGSAVGVAETPKV